MTWTLGLVSLAVVAASLLGGFLPLRARLTHTRMQLYLSVSAGVMLGAAFFHMMPEAIEQSGSAHILNWSAFGLITLYLVERFFASHHHEVAETPESATPSSCFNEPDHRHHTSGIQYDPPTPAVSLHWGAAAIGLTIHSLTGGVALASAFVIGEQAGGGLGNVSSVAWGVALATLLHKPADSLTIVSLMLRGGMKPLTAHLVNLVFALMVPLGVLFFFTGIQWWGQAAGNGPAAAVLAFSAGTFLCIGLSDLLPELRFHDHDRIKISVALLAGFGLMALTVLFHQHGSTKPAAPSVVNSDAGHAGHTH